MGDPPFFDFDTHFNTLYRKRDDSFAQQQEIIDISAEVSDLDEQDRSSTCINLPSPMSSRRSAKKKQPFSKKEQSFSRKEQPFSKKKQPFSRKKQPFSKKK